MKKLVSIILTVLTMSTMASGQCTVTAVASSNQVVCGQCVDISAMGQQGTPIMDNSFNNGNLGAGWVATGGQTVGTPCTPSLDGTPYYWASTATGTPQLTTSTMDVGCGGSVSFDMTYSAQGGATPCEGPDLPDEGVTFQYSIDGGVTWITIDYWDPMGGNDPMLTSWNTYTFIIPPGAISPNTQFQWIQLNSSGACCDNWGLDNVQILANDCGYYYDWAHIPGTNDGMSGGSVCPTTTTTYDVLYTDGISDTCYSSITITVLLPTITVTASPLVVGCGDCTILEATLTDIPPDSCCYTLIMDDSFGDGWNGGFITVNVNGVPSLGPFSATGNGSVVSFCVQGNDGIELLYTSGTWENENTYILQDPNGNDIFVDGPDPLTGSVFNTVANCGNVPIVWSYQWTGANITSPTLPITQACPITDGLYTVNVFDPNNPVCSISDGVFITALQGLDTAITVDVVNCGSLDYVFPDGTIQNGIINDVTYISNLTTVGGCDSIITTNIIIYPDFSTVEVYDLCPNTVITFPDGITQTITSDTIHVSNLLTVNGCDSIITTNVNMYYVPPVDISFSPNECPPAVIAITNNTPGTDCMWEIYGPTGVNQYSGCGLITDVFEDSGQYSVVLDMLSNDGCIIDTVINNAFEIYPEPLASFNWTPNIGDLLESTVYFTNTSIGGTDYLWSFGDGSESINYHESYTYGSAGTYTINLYVENQYGCSDTAQGNVIINNDHFLFVPNTFTPDGDEYNNTFKPTLYGYNTSTFHMTIYNRWGEIVFETYDTEMGWDGSFGGFNSQIGTYVWTITVHTLENDRRLYKGHVNILK